MNLKTPTVTEQCSQHGMYVGEMRTYVRVFMFMFILTLLCMRQEMTISYENYGIQQHIDRCMYDLCLSFHDTF